MSLPLVSFEVLSTPYWWYNFRSSPCQNKKCGSWDSRCTETSNDTRQFLPVFVVWKLLQTELKLWKIIAVPVGYSQLLSFISLAQRAPAHKNINRFLRAAGFYCDNHVSGRSRCCVKNTVWCQVLQILKWYNEKPTFKPRRWTCAKYSCQWSRAPFWSSLAAMEINYVQHMFLIRHRNSCIYLYASRRHF